MRGRSESSAAPGGLWVGRRARLGLVGVALSFVLLGGGSSPALAAETITVSSAADTLGAGASGAGTVRDALVVANETSNPALTGAQEPGGSGADGDCAPDETGSGSPYTVVLQSGQTYSLDAIDNYWFGPDGLPPISDAVTVEGNG